MNDRNFRCTQCKQLITIPPFGIGECELTDKPHDRPHKQKEYCPNWSLLRREMAYCAPTCSLNGRLIGERSDKVVAIEPPQLLSSFPPGSTVKRELDVDEAVAGAPLYFVVDWNTVVKLDPRTRSRSECDIPAFTRMYAV